MMEKAKLHYRIGHTRSPGPRSHRTRHFIEHATMKLAWPGSKAPKNTAHFSEQRSYLSGS